MSEQEKEFKFDTSRFDQKSLKPIVIYRKKDGEIVRVFYGNDLEEKQKLDKRVVSLTTFDGLIPPDVHNYFVINGIFKKKPDDVLKIDKKASLERSLVILKGQQETAKKAKFENALDKISEQVKVLNKQIADLGVE